MPRINVTSVLVDDQQKAKLGFLAKTDVPVGEFR